MNNRDACQLLRKKWIKLGQKGECGEKEKKRSKSENTKPEKITELIAFIWA